MRFSPFRETGIIFGVACSLLHYLPPIFLGNPYNPPPRHLFVMPPLPSPTHRQYPPSPCWAISYYLIVHPQSVVTKSNQPPSKGYIYRHSCLSREHIIDYTTRILMATRMRAGQGPRAVHFLFKHGMCIQISFQNTQQD